MMAIKARPVISTVEQDRRKFPGNRTERTAESNVTWLLGRQPRDTNDGTRAWLLWLARSSTTN